MADAFNSIPPGTPRTRTKTRRRPAALTPELRRQIERWFVRRGVPQLIEGYATEQRMDATAAPFIAVWLVIGTVLRWGTRSDWSPEVNALSVVGTLAFIGIAFTAIGWLRARKPGKLPARFDLVDIGLFALLPALASAVIEVSVGEFVAAGLNALLGIGVIYLVIAFGLLEIGLWAVTKLWQQLASIVSLLARTLPLLLILVVFLLFSAEIWEAAHALDLGEQVAVLVLLLLIAVLLVATTLRAELRRMEARAWAEVVEDARATPVAPLVDSFETPMYPPPRLTWMQRANISLLVTFTQLLQSFFVALLVLAFLVAFGLLVIPTPVQDRWVGEPIQIAARFELLGDLRTLSTELLTVSALLSGIVGLYFTGLALTDMAYRAEHFKPTLTEVSRLISARAVYADAVRTLVEFEATPARQRRRAASPEGP